jgi:anti-sigma B factor antagonist
VGDPTELGLAMSVSADGGASTTLRVTGEVDLATAPELASQLAALDGNGRAIDLDLERVTFIDLAGLRAILHARERDRRLRIAVPGQAVARLLELTGCTELLRADEP